MIQLEYLKEVMEQQLKAVSAKEKGLERDELSMLPDIKSHALIVSGIRRCGKSTCYFNFLEIGMQVPCILILMTPVCIILIWVILIDWTG